eukprot:5214437-Pyramimonas_sp.AAC.1
MPGLQCARQAKRGCFATVALEEQQSTTEQDATPTSPRTSRCAREAAGALRTRTRRWAERTPRYSACSS